MLYGPRPDTSISNLHTQQANITSPIHRRFLRPVRFERGCVTMCHFGGSTSAQVPLEEACKRVRGIHNWKTYSQKGSVRIEKALRISSSGCGYERLIDQIHFFPEALFHPRHISGQQNIDYRCTDTHPRNLVVLLNYSKSHDHHMGHSQEYPRNVICIAFWSPLCRTARRRLFTCVGIARFASCGLRTH